jgi:hypothetical protein
MSIQLPWSFYSGLYQRALIDLFSALPASGVQRNSKHRHARTAQSHDWLKFAILQVKRYSSGAHLPTVGFSRRHTHNRVSRRLDFPIL